MNAIRRANGPGLRHQARPGRFTICSLAGDLAYGGDHAIAFGTVPNRVFEVWLKAVSAEAALFVQHNEPDLQIASVRTFRDHALHHQATDVFGGMALSHGFDHQHAADCANHGFSDTRRGSCSHIVCDVQPYPGNG